MEGYKKWSAQCHKQFLDDRAATMAEKMRTTEEKALRVVISAEACRHSCYVTMKSLSGKQKCPLTQADVLILKEISSMHTLL
jgi:hypothetical protein